MPTSVFAQDGVVICRSWAAATYKGRAASYFSTKGGAVVLWAFDTEVGLLTYARLSTPSVAERPAVVPYLRSQLNHHDILDENDLEGQFRDSFQYQCMEIGKQTPMLFHYDRVTQERTPWAPPPSDPVILPSDHVTRNDAESELNDLAGRRITIIPEPPTPGQDDASKSSKESTSSFSITEERERSKDRLARLDVPPLPHGNKEAIAWGEMLPWLLSGQFWCHEGVHACDIPVTTEDNKMLSQDLLTVIQRAATVHKTSATQRGVQSLLKEEIGEVNGLELIKEGRGFELFQLRIRTGYSRGLGSETMSYLWDFMHAVQQSEETIDSFATRLHLLYKQVMLAEGCEMGSLTKKSIFVFGLAKGAYNEVLAPFTKRIQLGQGKMKLKTATLRAIQSDATNLLVTSRYYKDNVILPGRKPAAARAAAADTAPDSSSPASSDPMVEKLVAHLRTKQNLPRDVTDWIRQTYDCVHCFSNGHDTSGCFGMRRKYNVKLKPDSTDKPSTPTDPTTSGGVKGRQAVAPATEKAEKSNPAPKVSFATEPNTAPGTKSGKLSALVPAPVEDVGTDDESDVDESDDTFAMFETMTETDTDMLHALNQMATRQVESAQRAQGLDQPNLVPKPLSEKGKKTVARVANRDTKWVRPPTLCENWDAWESIEAKRVGVTEIANMTTSYSSTPVLCPDSGATNIMGPHHRDMFVDYVDIQNENRYVRLGDESRPILIHGTGTLCLEVDGKRIAYAHSLYVP
jgi:hypothetical protein